MQKKLSINTMESRRLVSFYQEAVRTQRELNLAFEAVLAQHQEKETAVLVHIADDYVMIEIPDEPGPGE